MRNSKLTILVIDDHTDLLEIIRVVLEDAGFNVVASADTSILSQIKAINPDLILLDCWLRDGDGDAICRDLKKDAYFQDIPIILFSAANNLQQKAILANADGFIPKPFDIDDLVNQLSNFLMRQTS